MHRCNYDLFATTYARKNADCVARRERRRLGPTRCQRVWRHQERRRPSRLLFVQFAARKDAQRIHRATPATH